MNEGDTKLWQQTTAQYRQIGMRNIIVSQKKKWPDALFEALVSPPDVSAMTLARATENRATAQLVYYGKADFGIGIEPEEIPDGLLLLMFVKEKSGWKFNTSRFMSLAESEDIAKRAKGGDFSFLDAPELQPPGNVPPLPKLCPIPELVGYVEIVSFGYETQLTVNSRSEHTVIDNVQSGLIIGGLKVGVNPIKVEVRPLPVAPDAPGGGKRHFEFSIYRPAADPGDPPKQIYTPARKPRQV
jgi:hypothetical protein